MAPATDATALLERWLQRDKKLITYRLLSRELRIHVDEAKKALAAFFESHRDKSDLDATYILIGRSTFTAAQPQAATTAKEDDDQDEEDKQVGSSSTPSLSAAPARSFLDSRVTRRETQADVTRQVIRLVSASELDSARSSLKQVSSFHIYSISPGRLRDPAQLTAVQHDLHTQQKYTDAWQQTNRGADLGVIINPNIKDNYDPTKTIPSLGGPSAPALTASKDSKPADYSNAKTQIKPESDAKTSSTTPATSAKVTTAAPSASSAGKKGGLDWSRAKPKESESKPAAVEKEASSSSKRSSARKALLGSDDEDDDDDKCSRKPMLVDDEDDGDEDDGKPEKLGYADDDDDDVEMADPVRGAAPRGTGKRADARTQTKAQQAAQRKELEAMMDSDGDDDDAMQVVEPSGATGGTQKTGVGKDMDPDVEMAESTVTDTMNGSEPAAPKRRVRKKRKIGSKKVRSKDERGYTVTKTVDEYESYSSDGSDTPIVVGSKRATGGAAKQQQTSTTDPKSTSTSASASPAPTAPAAKSTPAASNSSSSLRKPSASAAPTPAKKGQQSLNSFFTRKPKDK